MPWLRLAPRFGLFTVERNVILLEDLPTDESMKGKKFRKPRAKHGKHQDRRPEL
jgi:hypothetical protein